MIRPDVIITLPPTGNAGGQHHMASAVITREAYKLAGDPTKYPEQIKEGLRPWQPKKLYHSAGFGFPGEPPTPGRVTRINSGVYDALLGKTYAEIGTEARSMHKCQGMGAAAVAAGAGVDRQLSARRDDDCRRRCRRMRASLFDGVDTGDRGLAKFAGAHAAEGSHRRPGRDRRRRADRAEGVRHRQRRGDAEAAARRAVRGPRAARASCARMAIDEAAKLRDRFPAAPEGRRVPAGDRRSPTASGSKRWPTTASSCRASR